jgi:3,4-dihydroxy 2-butanone 4-phosphate synthase/GTP cyclohydrolase II
MGHGRIIDIEKAVAEICAGRMVILVDDESRENEGDLCCAAQFVTPEIINFMAHHGRGLICLTLTEERADFLGLKPMVYDNTCKFGTNFTTSIDAFKGIHSGLSAQDRTTTILAAISDKARPEDLVSPGHIFPIRARRGGVLVRPGQTEGSVDLANLAGLRPAGVICEIMNEDGTMARLPELIEFAERHDLNITTIADLIEYRMSHERLLNRSEERCMLGSYGGEWKVLVYTAECIPEEIFITLAKGDIAIDDAVLVRFHRECFAGDVLGSESCGCGQQLRRAMSMMAAEGKGALLYVRQENRGIGLHGSLQGCQSLSKEYETRNERTPTLALRGDLLYCGIYAQILLDLGIKKIRKITSRPEKEISFEKYGIELVDQLQL